VCPLVEIGPDEREFLLARKVPEVQFCLPSINQVYRFRREIGANGRDVFLRKFFLDELHDQGGFPNIRLPTNNYFE
jgi:hypothetical protein